MLFLYKCGLYDNAFSQRFMIGENIKGMSQVEITATYTIYSVSENDI